MMMRMRNRCAEYDSRAGVTKRQGGKTDKISDTTGKAESKAAKTAQNGLTTRITTSKPKPKK